MKEDGFIHPVVVAVACVNDQGEHLGRNLERLVVAVLVEVLEWVVAVYDLARHMVLLLLIDQHHHCYRYCHLLMLLPVVVVVAAVIVIRCNDRHQGRHHHHL